MNYSVIVIDDDNNRLSKIKAVLKSSSINVFTAENMYELICKIYKYNVKILIFNPSIVWINIIEFINEFKKMSDFNEFTIFFLYENIDIDLKKEVEKYNIICIKYPSHTNNLVKIIKSL